MSRTGAVISVSPFRCCVWKLHNRLEEHITEESCKDEIQSFLHHGQLIPALGRPIRIATSDVEVEVICGVRRLFVARHLNQPLLVELREMSDADAIVAMDMENRQRQDISPYERGIGYARWLRGGYFESQEKLASALQVSPTHVSRLLKLARLPSVVVGAFGGATDICEGWGLELADALENPNVRHRVINAARELAKVSPRPAPRDVYRELLSCSVEGRRPKPIHRDFVVKREDGVPLFRVRYQRNSIALVLPIGKVSAQSLDTIQRAVVNILEQPSSAESHAERSHRHASSIDSQVIVSGSLSS
jgi:ParB/RepB/Spo0J family partition protein